MGDGSITLNFVIRLMCDFLPSATNLVTWGKSEYFKNVIPTFKNVGLISSFSDC